MSNDSVGKINLDLEVKSDLGKQIGNVSNAIGKQLESTFSNGTKSIFDTLNKSIETSMQAINSTIKVALDEMKANAKATIDYIMSITKNIKMPQPKYPETTTTNPKTPETINPTMPRGPPTNKTRVKTTNIDIEALKAEIANLEATLNNINARIDQQKVKLVELREAYANAFNPNIKNKIQEQILKTEASINKMIGQSDKLGFKLADLDVKLASAGTKAKEGAAGFSNLSEKTKMFTKNTASASNASNKLNNNLKKTNSSLKNTSKNARSCSSGIALMAKSMFTWGIVFPIIIKGLGAMATGMMNNLNTSSQFVTSLNQIKTNLMVAFTPIYQAILPAINALMSSLATATAYIASFISAIFGKTYQQSYKATQGLIDAKNAMGAYGDSAKKTASELKGLAAFDEINNLNKDSSGADESKVPTLTQPSLDMSQVDATTNTWAAKLKDIMSKIFEPIKQAWTTEGKNTMDAFKYALGEILQLISSIGKSFLSVWTNGTGKKFCENILKLLQTIFNVIGDIAKAFNTAWNTGEIGTKLVQTIFDTLNSVLKVLIDIGTTFRTVWNNGIGVEICTNILQILTNVFTIIGQIAESFDKAWQTNGETIVTGILGILNNILSTISAISTNWINAWNNNGAGDALLQSMLGLLGSIVTTLSDVTSGIGESFGKATESLFPTFIEFCTSISGSLTNITDGFKSIWDNGGQILFDGIVQLGAQIADLIMNLSSSVFADFSVIFKDALAPAIGVVFDAIGTVLVKLAEFIEWINTNKQIIDGLKLAVEGLMAAWAVGKVVEFINISGGLIGALASIGAKLATTTVAQTAYNAATTIGTTLTTAWNGVCVIATGTTTALGVAFNLLISPIGLVILAITAVIATGVLLYNHWDVVKQKSQECWDFVKQQFKTFQNWLDGVFATDWSQKFGIFGDVLNGFLKTAQDMGNGLQTTFDGIIDFISGVFTGNWSQAWNGVKQIFKGVFDSFVGIAKAPINAVIGLINGLIAAVNTAIKGLNKIDIDIPDWIPGIGGESFGFNIPTIGKIPYLAKGGIVDSPTLAMVGEAGKEAVVPLENNTGWITQLAAQIASLIGTNSNSVNTEQQGGDIIFMIDGSVIGKVAIKQLRKMQRQGNITVIPT